MRTKVIHNGYTKVSDRGDVWRLERDGSWKKLKQYKTGATESDKKYLMVLARDENGRIKRYYVHTLVATAFIENPHNYTEVNHKDGDKQRNYDFNLEWTTHGGNMLHAFSTGLYDRDCPHCGNKMRQNKGVCRNCREELTKQKRQAQKDITRNNRAMKALEYFEGCDLSKIEDDRKWQLVRERIAGASLGELAKDRKISRQRVEQILKKTRDDLKQ